MHAEIEAVLNNPEREFFTLNDVTLQNAEKLLNYIEDINLERKGKFELTPAESLYLLWTIGDWDLHIECLKNGRILYTFRHGGYGRAWGSCIFDEFVPYLERFLLTGKC